MNNPTLMNESFFYRRRMSRRITVCCHQVAIFMLPFLAFLLSVQAYAQTNKVTGVVVDQSGEPIIGATVVVSGTTTGSVTLIDGTFSINVPEGGYVTVSYVGYISRTIEVGSRSHLKIVLEPDTIEFDEVVVVGYGVQKKINLTSAVASISPSEFKGKPITNIVQALQGVSPGLIIEESNSAPGSRISINIRGLNTMNDNTPLVIVDGIPGADIQNLLPGEIEHISVLKDASSTAIYGSRGSNGVLLITTKKGEAGRSNVSYDFQYGIQKATHLPGVVDSWIYASLRNEALVNSGQSIRFTPEEIEYYRSGAGPNVKWMEEIYRSSPQQSHAINITGGNERTTHMISLGYLDQESMFQGDHGMKRSNARMNISHKVFDALKINATAAYSRNNITDHAYWSEWIIEQCSRMPSIYSLLDEKGNYTYPSGSNSNPLWRLKEGGYRQSKNDEITGTLSFELAVLPELKLTGMVAGQLQNNQMHENRMPSPDALSGDKEHKITDNLHRTEFISTNIGLNYEKSFGMHNFSGMLGHEYQGTRYKWFETWRKYEDKWDYDIIGENELSGTNVGNRGNAIDRDIMYSLFGRVTYNYAEKYLLEFNLRNDRSSKFKKGNQGKTFPSMSAAWRMSEEDFYGDILKKYIPSVKLRASWGESGNNRTDNYLYDPNVTFGSGYAFGGNVVTTSDFSSYNEEIKWETTRMFDIGFDIGLFNNSLNLVFDYYNNYTRDILMNLPVTGIYGGDAAVQNYGEVGTTGWEIAANYRLRTGNVHHTFSGNISDSRNEVIKFGAESIGGYDVNTIIREGYPLWSYYAYMWDGFFQSEDEVAQGPHLSGITPKPGDIRYKDKNGDGLITEDEDRFIVGNRYPRYTYGFSYATEWKGFDFSMLWQGVGRRMVWVRGEAVEAFHNNNEGPVFNFHLDRWTPNNPNATYPRLTMGSESSNNAAKSNFWIENAAYLRLKNVQLGYTIPQNIAKKFYASKLRVYMSMQNPLTFSKMKGGWDPETSDSQGGGRIYPVAKVTSFGISLTF